MTRGRPTPEPAAGVTTRTPLRPTLAVAGSVVGLLAAFGWALAVGSEPVPWPVIWQYLTGRSAQADPGTLVLLTDFHLPRALTAVAAGAGLAVAGLLMQTLFANPLADPYILGVSSGASLGVAVSVLGTGSAAATFAASVGWLGQWGTTTAAMLGALAVLALVLLAGRWVRSVVSLLVVGVMIGAVVGAMVSVLLAFAAPAQIQRYVMWSLGSLDGTSGADMWVLLPVTAAGILLAQAVSPSLNVMLMGERYAASMGVPVRWVRTAAMVATAAISGVVTAYCGPIAFLGIAVPHLARVVAGRSDLRLLVPLSALLGAAVCLVCGVVATLPGTDGVLPLNVVTAVLGAPVVIALLIRSRTLVGS
ncbi:FecCD family ABC transporter permease [Nakamurella aerolata]|uniref:FecCD family ABC transporter permease n=1 Tax=Nakamurella aerolata TaxID=1656892 RepID=UPI001FE39837|nr:iron ABC transporter permease [Nakamurella aerolata]